MQSETSNPTKRAPIVHELKCHPPFFGSVKAGVKKFEIRKNDRDYQVDDILHLREFIPGNNVECGHYTGDHVYVKVMYITSWDQPPGQVVMSVHEINSPYKPDPRDEQIAQLTKERDAEKQTVAKMLAACRKSLTLTTAEHTAELARVLTVLAHTPCNIDMGAFLERIGKEITDRFRWNGEGFVAKEQCKTCDGKGEIGGWVGQTAEGGYESEPCPECNQRKDGPEQVDDIERSAK